MDHRLRPAAILLTNDHFIEAVHHQRVGDVLHVWRSQPFVWTLPQARHLGEEDAEKLRKYHPYYSYIDLHNSKQARLDAKHKPDLYIPLTSIQAWRTA